MKLSKSDIKDIKGLAGEVLDDSGFTYNRLRVVPGENVIGIKDYSVPKWAKYAAAGLVLPFTALAIGVNNVLANDSTSVSTTAQANAIVAQGAALNDSTSVDSTLVLPKTVVVNDTIVTEDRTFMNSNYPTHNVFPTQALLQPSMYRMVITPKGANDVDSLFSTVEDRLGENVGLKVMPADALLRDLSTFEKKNLGDRANVQMTYETLKQEAKKHPATKLNVARLNEAGKDLVFDPKTDSSLVDMIQDTTDEIVGFKYFTLPGKGKVTTKTTYSRGDTLYKTDSTEVTLIDVFTGDTTKAMKYDTNMVLLPDTQRTVTYKVKTPGESVSAVVRVQAYRDDAVPIENRLDAFMGHKNWDIIPDTVYKEIKAAPDTVTVPGDTVKVGPGFLGKYWPVIAGAAAILGGYLLSKGKDKGHGGSSEKPGIY